MTGYIFYAYNEDNHTIKCLVTRNIAVTPQDSLKDQVKTFNYKKCKVFTLRATDFNGKNFKRANNALNKYFSTRRCKYRWGWVRVNSKNCPITVDLPVATNSTFRRKTKDEILKCSIIKSDRRK